MFVFIFSLEKRVGFKYAYVSTLKERWVVVAGLDGSGDGQVLDLDTAVKDGVLVAAAAVSLVRNWI